jgi:hypothetical protein
MMAAAAAAGEFTLGADQGAFHPVGVRRCPGVRTRSHREHPTSTAAKLVNRFTRDADDILRFTSDTAIRRPPPF